ncbi:NADH-FMN oxidoreductase RutF, flavin reductase (DIM6/NTAB) family [Lachnospiraceae bacterium RM5]|nr:NADH-FMN oxidoreductase RutF, flavin reductase (DIM6/NTAB) family [Lachnospiraceae bacterium RM5]
MNEKTMQKVTYGLYVLTTKEGEKINGCIINTMTQHTTTPNIISITVNKQNYTEELIKKSGEFNVSIIDETAKFDLFKRFGFQSGRDVDKFADFDESEYKILENNIPIILKGVNSYVSAEVIESMDMGTHTLFIAKVTDMDIINDNNSASYAYYHANIKPKKEEVKSKGKVWVCKICGYVYDDEKEAVPFEELPDDWVCPLCKHPKSDFELQE